MNTTLNDDCICLEVNEGCVSCPFSTEDICGADPEVKSTHKFSYPVGCPLLDRKIEVVRC